MSYGPDPKEPLHLLQTKAPKKRAQGKGRVLEDRLLADTSSIFKTLTSGIVKKLYGNRK